LKITKEDFINGCENNVIINQEVPLQKQRSQVVNFTLYADDLFRIEKQIDRATQLRMRNKTRSALIRMALLALEECSDDEYIKLYEKY
jgi:hypothetical protein